jgi:TMEM175 potassium channel family protein
MTHRRPTPERLGAFSDGVFAVIITIMVLKLKPPSQPSFATLLPLWPTGLSYAVRYLFIAIVWVNRHHLPRFAEHATPRLIWWNLCCDTCDGEFSLPRVCLGGVGAGGSPREGLGTGGR